MQPLRAEHRQALGLHLLSLNADDRAARFGLALKDEAVLRWLAGVDWAAQRAWGAWLPGDGGLVAALQLAPTGQAGAWELAVSVHALARRRGVATRLLKLALAGLPEVRTLLCHHGHPALRAIGQRLGCEVRRGVGEPRLMLIRKV
ncbi:GNAT family N-acetyltransferase [Ottowia testudinis]|uniref:N-acetyltransferase domain-containing protein n=1 Tax=Ottowia testudinis TaxID=2816950 RepID=A0A975CDJ5_9BURK|nr:GNAT family N-acetyltransferase [Ottowia testudinis]QTD44483.1 hypothetical protein J1M35_15470 [Ottowia testudinis]